MYKEARPCQRQISPTSSVKVKAKPVHGTKTGLASVKVG
jgi:hypothetical protein